MTSRVTVVAPSLLDSLFDEPGVGRCLVGIDETVLRVNAEWLRLIGLSLDEVVGANVIELFTQTQEMALAMLARARAGNEVAVPRRSQVVAGRETWWEGCIRPIRATDGTQLLITTREITAASDGHRPAGYATGEREEDALREKLELIDAITNSTDDIIYAKDALGRFRFANPAALISIGKPLDQVLGRANLELLKDQEAAARIAENDRRIMARGVAMELEESVERDGTRRVWLSRKVPYRDDEGRVIGLLGISRDITERKRIEAERDALAQQHQLALDAAQMGWWHRDLKSKVSRYDKRCAEIFGISTRELNYRDLARLMPPEDVARVSAVITAALDPVQPKPFTVEYRINRPDGDLRWIESRGLAMFEGEGSARRAIGLVGTAADITDRKKVEHALLASQQLLQSTMDHLPSVIAYKDREGRILSVNKALEKRLGLPQALIRGKTLYDIMPRETADLLRQQDFEVMATRQAVQHESAIAAPGGGTRCYLRTSFPLIDADGQVCGTGHISHDITVVKRSEAAVRAVNEQLREAHRQKDEFLATLAHELRNPLAPIRTAVELIRLREPNDDTVRRASEIIERQSLHLTRLVDDLLDVSRITTGTIVLRLETLDLSAVARGAVEAVRSQLDAAGLVLDLQASQPPPMVSGDATRLAQCIMNLLANAIKFTRAGGRIGVKVLQEGPTAVLEVSDSGTGIGAANLERIFEMFVQEHPSGWQGNTGLGIGLALTRKLVTLHGGSVHAASAGAGQGSTFRIELPALGGSKASFEPAAGSLEAECAARILVVDDNPDAADTMGAMLAMRGFSVTVEYSGEAAVDAVERQVPDAVLLDIGLPGIDGYEACRRIRRSGLASQPVVIALTGWGQFKDREMAIAAGFDAHLTKPAEPDRVIALLRQRLAAVG